MPSARTTARRAAVRAEDSSPDQVASSILVLLSGIERHDPRAPAALAFRTALARKGRELAKAGGPAAFADMLARIRAADPAQADARETILTTAWAGLLPVPEGT
ncbi:hypothetical protein MKL09_29645 [Methylobacterium sp. J-048]|uniref:hypothetical protein n=1 Tax=unclassified Methylobacterium TaxID=2615210 RepID=UPI001FBA0A1B|nr:MULTISPECIES: hypothetical protein [unclassified Methylobacterium]MCJ2060671.1 hypothetical protein [Methylobacterium sp. J-048]MCJ2139115.1 hypothetical protein [Methylobacterium sp. E-066]